MSQRDSGYERKERDCYETPEWVTVALLSHLPERISSILEPAAGSGKMAAILDAGGYMVTSADIVTGQNFLSHSFSSLDLGQQAIITNPPYELATDFIEHAINLTEPMGFVAMLLRTDFDHAKSRQNLFGRSHIFSKKLVLTRRIRWFEDSKGSPSFNHAWFMWDWRHMGPPNLAYAH